MAALKVTSRQRFAIDHFVAHGYLPKVAAAFVGNGCGESGENLDSTFDRVHADHESGGAWEWRDSPGAPRKTRLATYSDQRGANLRDDLATQCDYLIWELQKYFANLEVGMRNPGSRSIATLTANFCWIFENPAKATAGLGDPGSAGEQGTGRIGHAELVYTDFLTRHPVAAPAPAPQGAPTPAPAPAPAPVPMPSYPMPSPAAPMAPEPAPEVLVPAGDRRMAAFQQLLAIQKSYDEEESRLKEERAPIDAAVAAFALLTKTLPATPPAAPKESKNMINPLPPKPAIDSTTIWGGIFSIVAAAPTLLSTFGAIAPAQWQPIIGGLGAILGGLTAIYGRNNASIAPIKGILSSKP
jgi:Phage tail lysozyme